MNKRGWMRIMEATIAVMIVSGVMVSVYSSQSSSGGGAEEYYEGLQKEVILDISSRADLRNDVLDGEMGELIIFTDNNIPTTSDYFLKICDLGEVCKMDEEVFISTVDKDVYVEETVVSSTLEEYKPSIFKFFIWDVPADHKFCGDGVCNAGSGEVCGGCIADCDICISVSSCGNAAAVCDADETCLSCSDDCGECVTDVETCGNGRCSGDDTPYNCPEDCGAPEEDVGVCSDDTCDPWETCDSCSDDCGVCDYSVCGENGCETGEDVNNCPEDCVAPVANLHLVFSDTVHSKIGGIHYYTHTRTFGESNGVGVDLAIRRLCYLDGTCTSNASISYSIDAGGELVQHNKEFYTDLESDKFILEYWGMDDNGNNVYVNQSLCVAEESFVENC